MSLFEYAPHPHIAARKQQAPPTIAAQHGLSFNGRIAKWITEKVGTMTCAYLFAAIALIALPQALQDTFRGGSFHALPLVTWTSQAFLQLVLLSILMVGQQLLGVTSDQRAIQTYNDAEAVLHEAQQIQQHLLVQDGALEALASHLKVPLKG
jgi:hypothetical protein